VSELRARRKQTEWPKDGDLVFPTTTGTAMADENLRKRTLIPAAQEAGVPWIGFHTFRHTCGSLLIAEGRNSVQVSRWLGHHSPAFTLTVYAHLLDDGVGDALDLFAGAQRLRVAS
jgi:integrase